MPFNVSVFKTRTLTAIVFVVIMLAGLFWNAWSYIGLLLIIHFGCWYEYIKLIKKIVSHNTILFAIITGLFYITLPTLVMINMAKVSVANVEGNQVFLFDNIIPCTIIFSIWINDTMAYIVGSLIGKTPFSSISPKKTWEGTIGGALLCVVAISLIAYFSKLLALKDAIIISAICAVFGTLGDLLESKIKRMADVKDSGSFMPGHGGFLDRFDSLLIAASVVWIYMESLM